MTSGGKVTSLGVLRRAQSEPVKQPNQYQKDLNNYDFAVDRVGAQNEAALAAVRRLPRSRFERDRLRDRWMRGERCG